MNKDNELIAKILTGYSTLVKSNLELGESVELEFRLGSINDNGKYVPGVDRHQFNKLEKASVLMDLKSKKSEQSLVLGSNLTYSKTLRNIVNLKTKESYYEEKNKLDTMVLPHLQMRLSVAKERILNAEEKPTLFPNIARYRDRNTYKSIDKNWEICFTRTLSLHKKEELNSSYIKEWLNGIKNEEIDNFEYEVEIEYGGNSKDSKEIYLSSMSLLSDLSHVLLGNNAANTMESDMIVEKIQGMLSDEFSYNRLLIGVKNISMSTLLPRVHSLTRHVLGANKENYSVTYKADGYRMLLYIPPDSESLMINYKKNVISTGLIIGEPWKGNTVIDGEYMEDSNTFLAFDIVIDKSNDVSNKSYLERYQLLLNFDKSFEKEEKSLAMDFKIKPSFIRGRDIGPGLRFETLFSANSEMLNYISKEKIKFDGLIFYPPGGYRDEIAMKWKPNDMRTIDMRLILSKSELSQAKSGSRVSGMVLVTIRRADYMENRRWMAIPPNYLASAQDNLTSQWTFEIPFMQSNNLDLYNVNFLVSKVENQKVFTLTESGAEIELINNDIYEFYYKGSEKVGMDSGKKLNKTEESPCYQWCISRSRNDEKEWPNSFQAASDVWNTITNPITEEMIRGIEELPASYFIENASSTRSPIKEQKAMHLYVKDITYKLARTFQEKITDSEPVLLELGVGRGGSLHSWARNGWKTIVGIDMDSPALEEAHRRFNETMESGKYDMLGSTLTTLSGDMSKPDSWIGESTIPFGKEQFNCVSCQFAIMYSVKDYETFNQFVDVVDKNLVKGGTFICTAMNGQSVIDLFNNNDIKYNEKYVWVKNNINGESEDVYSLMRKFETDKLEDVGQKISSYVQTIGTHTEWLTNIDYIVNEFVKKGYNVVLNQSFNVTLDEWKTSVQEKRGRIPTLSEAELDWISLQQVFVLEKGEPVDKPKQRKRRTKSGSASTSTQSEEVKIPKKRGRPKGKKSAKKIDPTAE